MGRWLTAPVLPAASQYETGLAAVRAGAIPTGNMTSSCAAAKFRWVLANVDRDISQGVTPELKRLDRIRKDMQQIFVDEMDPVDSTVPESLTQANGGTPGSQVLSTL